MTKLVIVIILYLNVICVNCGFSKRETYNDPEITGKSLGRVNGSEMYEYEGHEYIFHLEPRTWEDAIVTCQREGGYLAVIEDPYEVNFLANAMEGRLCSNTVFQNVWIGGRYFPEAKRWLWDATGYEVIEAGLKLNVEFPPWKLVSKPNHDCLNLHQELNHQPKFTNLECHRKRRFLCERGCTKLYDTDRGIWSPDGCILDPAVSGDECRLVCHSGMELDGANPLMCTRFGWNNSIGVNVIPDCKGADEITDDFLEELRQALDEREGSLVVVIDETVDKAVFDMQIKFVLHITQHFLPSELRLVGLVGNGEFSRMIASGESLKGKSACELHDLFASIAQESSSKSDLTAALQKAHDLHQELSSVAPIIIVISGNHVSASDSRSIASYIKSSEGIILTIGIGKFNSDELISIASSTQEGPLFFAFSNFTNFDKMNKRLENDSVKNDSLCRKEVLEEFYSAFQTSSADASLLYVLDLTNSWDQNVLNWILEFMEIMTSAFPLSQLRHGGLIIQEKYSKVEIALRIDNTCIFKRHIAKIEIAFNHSDHHLHEQLDVHRLAQLEIKRNNPNRKTILVVISQTNAAIFQKPWEESLDPVYFIELETKQRGTTEVRKTNTVKTLKIGNLEQMNDTIRYLQTLAEFYNEDCSTVCTPLKMDSRGKWTGRNGSCIGTGKLGQRCYLVCLDAYELVGSNPLICTEDGWSGTAGDDVIPKCLTPEEIAVSFMEKINGVLANEVDSNLLFVLDESGSVTLPNFQMEIDFVSSVVDAFPLSVSRRAGLTVFSDTVRVVIAATAQDTCRFLRASRRVRYRGGQTDIRKALTKTREEIEFRAVHPQNLVFLITDGISQTDPSEAAELLRSDGAVLFIIGVADYDQEQLEPLASIGPDGTTNFFGVKSFRVFHVIADYLNSTYRAEGVDCSSSQRLS